MASRTVKPFPPELLPLTVPGFLYLEQRDKDRVEAWFKAEDLDLGLCVGISGDTEAITLKMHVENDDGRRVMKDGDIVVQTTVFPVA